MIKKQKLELLLVATVFRLNSVEFDLILVKRDFFTKSANFAPPPWHSNIHHMSDHTCSDPPLPTCKTSIVVTATIFTLFKANTKETTKEVARPKAAPPLLWWKPKAATFVCWL